MKQGGKRLGAGRKRKEPGEPIAHRLTDGVRLAIEMMVAGDLTREEAAKAAGLSKDTLRKAMRDNPIARSFYASETRSLLHCLKHHAVHVLRKEMTGPNAAARVAAARTLLADETARPLQPLPVPQLPGVTIVIEAAPGRPAGIIGQSAPLIEIPARPVESER